MTSSSLDNWRIGQNLGGPMRLGVTDPAPRRPELARQQTPQSNCKKWRRIAERLGETYAGLRLRQAVVDRACLFADIELASAPAAAESGSDRVWAWPWADGAIDPSLPPRLHANYGDWSIRCGLAGRRERCALIHEAMIPERGTERGPETGRSEARLTPIAQTPIAETPIAGVGSAAVPVAATAQARVVTHFVIDTISGHSHVVWRVFVERGDSTWFRGAAADGGPTAADLNRADQVRFSSGTLTGTKRFDGCTAVGCLMEADMTTSARLATRLWEGTDVSLTVQPVNGIAITATVPAQGVRAALGELARLKRAEDKVLARN
jgi:invasion protein IalB